MRNEDERKRMGRRIATLRLEAGMTQEELADKAGIQRTHIVRIEQGKYGVTIDVLAAIADALGASVEMIKREV